MKVTIEWSEHVLYRSEIEVDTDSDEFKEWANGQPVTDQLVEDYLSASGSDDREWFDQVDAKRDFVAVDERTLDGVTGVTLDRQIRADAAFHDILSALPED